MKLQGSRFREPIRKKWRKKMKKKLLNLLLAIALVLTTAVLPANVAFAAMVSGNVENEETEDVFTWTYDLSENKLVVGGNGEFENLYDVGESDYSLEDYKENAVTIVIQSGVTKIGDNVFSGCYKLKSVSIPKTVTEIGCSAFGGCEELESITLPEGLKKIGGVDNDIIDMPGAFSGCISLSSIVIPSTVTEIGVGTFEGCISLESVSFSSGLEKIGAFAFRDCESIAEISIPRTMVEIGQGAFEGCSVLENVALSNSTKMKKIDRGTFAFCNSLKEITLPDSVTTIGYNAFLGCSALRSISLPSALKTIDMNAFASCSSLADVEVNQGTNNNILATIDEFAFSGCKALGNITLPKGLSTIGKAAFEGCINLNEITIPENVSSIGAYAYGYSSLNYGSWTDNGYPIVGGTKMPNAAIFGISGTQAEVYAKANNIPFNAVEATYPQTLSFAEKTVSKTYGDVAFTQTVINDKSDGGTVTYSSNNPEVASVETSTGKVTINNVGTATITAEAAEVSGKYTSGTASYTVTVSPKIITPSIIVAGPDIAPGAYIFSGTKKEPAVTVKDGESVIPNNQYTVTYSNNVDAGEATVLVSSVADGNYAWPAPANAHFTISKAEAPTLTYAEVTVKVGTEKEFTMEISGIPGNAKPSCFDLMQITNEELLKNRIVDSKTGKVTVTTSTKGKAGDKVIIPIIVIMENYENAIANVVVNFVDKDIPTISVENISTTFNGKRVSDEAIKGTATCKGVDVEGTWAFKEGQNLTSVAESGKKTVVFIPADQDNFACVEAVIEVEIKKAVYPLIISFEKVSTSGKTLGDITPPGIDEYGDFIWNDGDETPIVANGKYGWTFIPCDSENYEIMYGEVTPWIQSFSGGIGGGSFVPSTTDEQIEQSKADAIASITKVAETEDYEAEEKHEVNAILEKAKTDIENAKTEEEVKAIEEEAKKDIEAIDTAEEKEIIRKVQAVEKGCIKLTSRITTLKGKKAILLTWEVPGGIEFDGFDIYKSVKRYSSYGKKPYYTSQKTKYFNTKNLQMGRTYYYKLRAFKIVNGRKVYTNWSTKAWRTV